MVKVKLFGILRLDSGVKEFETEASQVKDIFPVLIEKVNATGKANLTMKDMKGYILSVNGNQVKKNAKLQDGDVVMFTSPTCGG